MTDLIARLRTMSATGWHPIGNEAADEIERLRAAVQHEADCVETYRAQCETLTRELAEARAERDALAKDAERYRWLRVHGDDESVCDEAWRHLLAGEQLDAAIDAQIEKERSE